MSRFQYILTRTNAYFPLVLCLSLGLLSSSLLIYLSKDALGYKYMFGLVVPRTWAYVSASLGLANESLFKVMMYVLGNTIGFAASMMLMTIFFLTIKLQYLGKITNQFYLSVFFYTCFYLFLLEGTVARVGFATAIVMMAIYYFKESQYWKSALLILLSTQIHFSAVLFLLIFPLYFIEGAALITVLTFIAAPLCAIFDISIFSLVMEILGKINPRYLLYSDASRLTTQNSTGLFFPYIGFFSLFLGVVYLYLKEKVSSDKFIKTMFLVCMIGIILMWFFYDHVVVAARLGELLLLPIVILLSTLDVELRNRQLFFERRILYAVSILYFLARFYYLYIR